MAHSFSDTFTQDLWAPPSSPRRDSHITNPAELDSPTFFALSTAFFDASQFDEILRLPTPPFPKSPSPPTVGPFTFSDPFKPTTLEEESSSGLPGVAAPQDAEIFVNGRFDRARGFARLPAPPSSLVGSPSLGTVSPKQIFLAEGKHAYAEDAMRERRGLESLLKDSPLVETICPKLLMSRSPTPPVSQRKLKRTRSEGSSSQPQADAGASHPRVIVPIPRRAGSLSDMIDAASDPFALPPFVDASLLFERSPSPPSIPSSSSSSPSPYPYFSSAASSPRPGSDTECEDEDDEYIPSGDERAKKRRKPTPPTTSSSSSSRSSSSRQPSKTPSTRPSKAPSSRPSNRGQTQLQLILESFPFKPGQIKSDGKVYYCPFPDCEHRTTSEGDMGRHLESSAHATHTYMCLAAECLETFAREDSMKRHHRNERGRGHKAEHERRVQGGWECRVRKEEVEEVRVRVRAVVGA